MKPKMVCRPLASQFWITAILVLSVAAPIGAQNSAGLDKTTFVSLGGLEHWISTRPLSKSLRPSAVLARLTVITSASSASTIFARCGPNPIRTGCSTCGARRPNYRLRSPNNSRILKTEWNSPPSACVTRLRRTSPKTACDIHTAYFVIQGQDDVITPTQVAVDYFKCIKAPKKELILILNAGHFAFMTAPDKFLEALISKGRPVAIASGA